MRAALLLLPLLLWAAPPARCLGEAKPWNGGLFVESCGFAEAAFLPPAACLSAGLFLEPLALPAGNPAVFAGILLPVAPGQTGDLTLRAGLALTLFDARLPWLCAPLHRTPVEPGAGRACSTGWTARPALHAGRLPPACEPGTQSSRSAPRAAVDKRGRPRGWGQSTQAALFVLTES
jgi:hypothetical protein